MTLSEPLSGTSCPPHLQQQKIWDEHQDFSYQFTDFLGLGLCILEISTKMNLASHTCFCYSLEYPLTLFFLQILRLQDSNSAQDQFFLKITLVCLSQSKLLTLSIEYKGRQAGSHLFISSCPLTHFQMKNENNCYFILQILVKHKNAKKMCCKLKKITNKVKQYCIIAYIKGDIQNMNLNQNCRFLLFNQNIRKR